MKKMIVLVTVLAAIAGIAITAVCMPEALKNQSRQKIVGA